MCECRPAAAPAEQLRVAQHLPGEWERVCMVPVAVVPVGRQVAHRRCGVLTQGAGAGAHTHHLTCHPSVPWVPEPGHP
jgi:hypothetical protein